MYGTDTATFGYNMIGSEWTPMQRKNALTLSRYSVPRRAKLVESRLDDMLMKVAQRFQSKAGGSGSWDGQIILKLPIRNTEIDS